MSERGREVKQVFCNIHSDSYTVLVVFCNRTVENGKETVEEWEDNILKRRLVDGTLQLTD